MTINISKLIVLLTVFSIQSSFLHGQETANKWHQFRGPNRNGISPEINLPSKLLHDGATLNWKKSIGEAFSEMVVVEDRVYTMFSEKIDSTSGTEYIAAIDEASGEFIWTVKIDSIFIDDGGFGDGPRSTPFVDGDMVYCLSSWGKLYALNINDGKVIWKVDFIEKYQSAVPRWAFSTSPLIIGNSLIIEVGGKGEKGFAAYDKETGKELWIKGTAIAHYCSPLYAQVDGKKVVLFPNRNTLYAFNEHGDTLWTHKMTISGPTAMPIVFDNNKIFVSNLHNGYTIIEVNGNEIKEILKGSNLKNDYSSSIYYDGHFYGFHVAALQCIDAKTGEKKWSKRGFGKGSLIMVDGRLLVLSDKGKLIEVLATSKAYIEIGTQEVLQGKCWTAPAYLNGKIYVRNLSEMASFTL